MSLSRTLQLILVVLLVVPVLSCEGQQPSAETVAPASALSHDSFGALIERLSGEPGYFDTDNLISNESSYLHVIPDLEAREIKGGAYLGVGPCQNFSYIAHIQPSIAIIVDIRRDNMLLHLLYKALFEMADDRADFLALLFARTLPGTTGASGEWDIEELMQRIEAADLVEDMEALHQTVATHMDGFGIHFTEQDKATIERFHALFIKDGPALRFTSHNRSPRPYYPTYRQLASERDKSGSYASFLSTEPLFQNVKRLHEANRLIPVVGNFAAPDAIPAVAEYLAEIGEEVSAFYTSNVEYYLMYQRNYDTFLDNIEQLPRQENSVIVRSYFNRYRSMHPQTVPGYASTQLVQPINGMLANPEASYVELIFEHSK